MVIVKSYACISDARIRKILYALRESHKKILYSGSYYCTEPDRFKYLGIDYSLIFRVRSIANLFRAAFLDYESLLKLRRGDIAYFIDETIPFILLPFLIFLMFKGVGLYLDLFDSVYLKTNKNIFIGILLRLIYLPFVFIIVTDKNRARLMRILIGDKKLKIIENYPFFSKVPQIKSKSLPVKLFFYGSLSERRGWPFVKQFFGNTEFLVYLAGWNFLGICEDQLPHNFIFIGLLSQSEILEFMHKEIDWVFCLYDPISQNNINASPNKVYDAMHTGCGTIINSEVFLSDFVKSNNLGIVIDNYYDEISGYIEALKDRKFICLSSKEQLMDYSFDKYLDFYKSI